MFSILPMLPVNEMESSIVNHPWVSSSNSLQDRPFCKDPTHICTKPRQSSLSHHSGPPLTALEESWPVCRFISHSACSCSRRFFANRESRVISSLVRPTLAPTSGASCFRFQNRRLISLKAWLCLQGFSFNEKTKASAKPWKQRNTMLASRMP